MTLSARDVAALLGEARESLEGARVEHVHQPDEHTLVLTLRRPGEERAYLRLCVRPGGARLILLASRPAALPSPPPFCEAARRRLEGARLAAARQVSGDRVVELSFVRPEGQGERGASLVLEIQPRDPQLALLDSARRVVAGLPRVRRGGRDLEAGDAYRFPESRPASPALKALGESPWGYLGAAEEAGDADPARWPLHAAFERRYEAREALEAFEELKRRGAVEARRALARRRSTIAQVTGDLESARGGDEHRRLGELLKSVYPLLRRGLEEVEAMDYAADPPAPVRIPLRPDWSPQENIAWRFKRHQKSRRAIPILEARIATLEAEAARIEGLAGALAAAATLEEAAEAEARLREAVGRGVRAGGKKGPAAQPREGPRMFRSSDGFEILVGRSARKNDELTFRLARGNDWFLHVAGRPGAHVIVRAIPGKPPPLTTLLEAAQLALYYSLPERSAPLAGTGAAADVDYTQVKHVRKPRGLKPGAVLLSSHRTLRVALEREVIERLRAGGGGSPGG